jgi:signal peptidase I
MPRQSLKDRLKAPTSKWVRLSIWSGVFLLFTLWTGSAWWLLVIPFLFDLYVTRLLPWGFWKTWKNKTMKTIMDWVDAIVFALVAVYIINIFFFQNYQIPSSSLEKTLLVGDFLFVSKLSYGPRMPNTPVAFPLAAHTLPIIHTKSYLDKPYWKYHRIKGTGHVQRNDIVVFNFPAGDTVMLNLTNPDYYTVCYEIAQQNQVSLEEARHYIWTHPNDFGKVIYRPVDRRENYVKRCVGMPGDTLQIRNNQLYINGIKSVDPPGIQYNYYIQTTGSYLSDRQFKLWDINLSDRSMIEENSFLATSLPLKRGADGHLNPTYRIPLTKKTLEVVKNSPFIDTVFIEPDHAGDYNLGGTTYPLSEHFPWSRDNYGPIWIPKKGVTIPLTEDNLILYGRVIRNYESVRSKSAMEKLILTMSL